MEVYLPFYQQCLYVHDCIIGRDLAIGGDIGTTVLDPVHHFVRGRRKAHPPRLAKSTSISPTSFHNSRPYLIFYHHIHLPLVPHPCGLPGRLTPEEPAPELNCSIRYLSQALCAQSSNIDRIPTNQQSIHRIHPTSCHPVKAPPTRLNSLSMC
jgi:hypothetical protein